MKLFDPWGILKAIEEDPAQRRASLIPCGILAMFLGIVLAVLLFPILSWLRGLTGR